MLELFILLAIGIVIGLFLMPKKFTKINGKLQQIFIIIMIFAMGVSYGANPEFFKNLKDVGVISLIFSVVTLIAGVLLTYFVTKIFFKEKK
ncbi:MAG: LysO family transporter [Oscillospiraceae bacterium]|nr:LysO family transporter [Oscillospiraceae bacterium]